MWAAFWVMLANAIFLSSQAVAAAPLDEQSSLGSVTILYRDGTDGEKAITGAVFEMKKIADIRPDGSYQVIEDIDEKTRAEIKKEIYAEVPDVARIVEVVFGSGDINTEDISENNALMASANMQVLVTDSEGEAFSDQVPVGLYVCRERGHVVDYESSEPFLMALPFMDEGKWSYEAKAEPKPKPVQVPPQGNVTTDPGGKPSTGTVSGSSGSNPSTTEKGYAMGPKTGDAAADSLCIFMMICAMSSLVIVVMGQRLYRNEKKGD
ncbi:MAG: hypothetical protein KBS83_01935 [Lachnospiraceae bacterium]|nr:hypothetical protein [Candidatus Equihabitans merdae]